MSILLAAVIALETIRFGGSDTMYPMNLALADAYGQANPSITIAAEGGGSVLGIRGVIDGSLQLGASSRDLTPADYDAARAAGVRLRATPVALDGLAIVVNETNTVPSLTLAQVREIFTGRIRNWNEVGGPNLTITPYSRDFYSGTYGFMRTDVLNNNDFGPSTRYEPSTADEATKIAQTPGGIGYGGIGILGRFKGVRVVPIRPREGAEAIFPTKETVQSRDYPIWRRLYVVTAEPTAPSSRRFIAFVLSPEGQRIIEQSGYFPLAR
jgi:phosphate transport system substrate-binding protein